MALASRETVSREVRNVSLHICVSGAFGTSGKSATIVWTGGFLWKRNYVSELNHFERCIFSVRLLKEMYLGIIFNKLYFKATEDPLSACKLFSFQGWSPPRSFLYESLKQCMLPCE